MVADTILSPTPIKSELLIHVCGELIIKKTFLKRFSETNGREKAAFLQIIIFLVPPITHHQRTESHIGDDGTF